MTFYKAVEHIERHPFSIRTNQPAILPLDETHLPFGENEEMYCGGPTNRPHSSPASICLAVKWCNGCMVLFYQLNFGEDAVDLTDAGYPNSSVLLNLASFWTKCTWNEKFLLFTYFGGETDGSRIFTHHFNFYNFTLMNANL